MNKKTLQYIGAALYSCEGTKARRDHRTLSGRICSIELTNSDPQIISIFSKFLRNIIVADWSRIRGQLFIYPDLEEGQLKRFWSRQSNIPLSQFQKSIILKAKNGKFKANPLGTFKIRYSCKDDFLKLEKMINDMWRDAGVV